MFYSGRMKKLQGKRGFTHPVPVPCTLRLLHGPRTGEVSLPIDLYWGVNKPFNLDDPDDLRTYTEVILTEATRKSDIRKYLNGNALQEVWGDLMIPPRVQDAWEQRFPHLKRVSA